MGVSVAKAEAEVSRAVISLLLEEPFFAHLIGETTRKITKDIPTAAVAWANNRIELWVNPDFYVKEIRTKSQRTAILKHEILHLLLKHIWRMNDRHKRLDPNISNLAADLVVNQLIGKWDLPESAITLMSFPDLKLPADKTMDYYYDRLKKLQSKMPQPPGGAGKSGQAGQDSSASGSEDASAKATSEEDASGDGGQGQGEQDEKSSADAGGGSGAQDDAQSTSQDEQAAGGASSSSQGAGAEPDYTSTGAPQSAQKLDELTREGGSPTHSVHDHWSNGEPDPASESALEHAIMRAARRAGPKGRGTLPGVLGEIIDAVFEKHRPQVDWRRALRMFSGSAQSTRLKSTQRRFSKRHGTLPGTKIKRFQKLAVAIDTSGSVSDEEIELCFSEISAMHRAGADITILECDTEIQRTYKFTGAIPQGVAGRGGTDFNPPMKWLRERWQERFDGLIYLTDGEAPCPGQWPPCPLIWVLTPHMKSDHLTKGRVIHLEETEA